MRGPSPTRTNRARALRRNATDAERILWQRLRNRALFGQKFARQQPISAFVVDFVCRERRIIVEVDGGQHADSERDRRRDRFLQDAGYSVLRFWNNDVIANTEGVLERIAEALTLATPPHPDR